MHFKKRFFKCRELLVFALAFSCLNNLSWAQFSPIPFPTAKPGATSKNIEFDKSKSFASFLNAFNQKQDNQALMLAATLTGLDKELASWLIATDRSRSFSYETIKHHQAFVANWPGQTAMQRAQEERLIKFPSSTNLANTLSKKPFTAEGKILQIRSLFIAGRHNEARQKLSAYWLEENFSPSEESQILKDFSSHLSQVMHEKRVRRLLYDERVNAALRILNFLPAKLQALTRARIAVIRKQEQAASLLEALPQGLKKHEDYFFAKVQYLRRQDQWIESGHVMRQAPIQTTYPRKWWIERRLVSRKVLEAGHASLAYEIAANHGARKNATIVDAEFHAGWYALRFLNAPDRALIHFKKIVSHSKRPLSQSRGLYWMARSYKAMGNNKEALAFFQRSAHYRHTYYGQLALEELGIHNLALPAISTPPQSVQQGFDQNKFVRVIKQLTAHGAKGRTGIFYRHLSQNLKHPDEIVLLARLAEKSDLHQIALQIGKTAISRGIDVPRLAFPLGAIPESINLSSDKKALAYAIARQESAFNISITSSANAKGLMQLLPSTARDTARHLNIAYHPEKLTRDAAYNAILGSAFLNQLIKRFGSSLPLAFAGYNAGPSRSQEWIKRFGDPRHNTIDAIDWVEAIPFSETRNYVQRVMENLQVYRYRLKGAHLTISKDLNGGTQ